VIVGAEVGDTIVPVGMTLVFMTIGVSDISTLAQAERKSSRKRFRIRFIN
jgi:hypothetical protein